MQRYIIGIDGGGTKTEAVLCDLEGNVVRRLLGGPSGATGLPFQEAAENLKTLVEELLDSPDGPLPVEALFAGISGCGLPANQKRYADFIGTFLPKTISSQVGSDVVCVLTGEFGKADGIVAVCGTGSVAYARTGENIFRVDGHGYLLGDDAGGYHLGKMAINAALRSLDGRLPETLLTKLCEEKLGGDLIENLGLFYEGGKRMIASFAPCLIQAQEQGDAIAGELMEKAAQAMADTIRAAGNRIASTQKPVALCGGLWRKDGFMFRRVSEILGENYTWILPSLPPVYGATVCAALSLGITDTAAFRSCFEKTYKNKGE
ncbi:MAG: hypothetical protein IJW78_05625 [Clostridia bacterium]|nr:hypothetical protein [Clostridia bacterium]